MNAEVKEIVDAVIPSARKNLENDKNLTPVAFIMYGTKQLDIVGCPWSDAEEKEMSIAVLRAHCRQVNAFGIIIVAEMWYAEVAKTEAVKDIAEAMAQWDGVMPSKRPDRKEGVMFRIEALDGVWYGLAQIIRTDDKVTFGDVDFQPFGERDARARFQKFLARR